MEQRKNKNEKGQAMVEFAIVLPLLLLILCGILDFGWIYYNSYQVEDVSYQGARYAFVTISNAVDASVDEGSVKTATKNYVEQHLSGAKADVTITSDDITVSVEKEVKCLTFVGSTFVGRTYTAKSKSVAAR